MYRTTNSDFTSLSRIGTRTQPRNRVNVRTAGVNRIGVRVEQPRRKAATTVDIVVPAKRSGRGSRRAAHIRLNGSQARELFETLYDHFDMDTNRTSNRYWF